MSEACWCSRDEMPPYGRIVWLACSRIPCVTTEPRCPVGLVEAEDLYYQDGVTRSVCFCATPP